MQGGGEGGEAGGGGGCIVGLCHVRSHEFKGVGGSASAAGDVAVALCAFTIQVALRTINTVRSIGPPPQPPQQPNQAQVFTSAPPSDLEIADALLAVAWSQRWKPPVEPAAT